MRRDAERLVARIDDHLRWTFAIRSGTSDEERWVEQARRLLADAGRMVRQLDDGVRDLWAARDAADAEPRPADSRRRCAARPGKPEPSAANR